MFIFTLQSSQLSVCVCLRSTDLVMNNLFHAGNTFCETQQSSVESLQSTDWGVSNYNSTILWGSKRNTLTPLSKDVTFNLRVLILTHRHKSIPFYLWKKQLRNLLNQSCNVLNRISTLWLVATVCCACSNCTGHSQQQPLKKEVTCTFSSFFSTWVLTFRYFL